MTGLASGQPAGQRPRYTFAHLLRLVDVHAPTPGEDYPVAVAYAVGLDDRPAMAHTAFVRLVAVPPAGQLVATLRVLADFVRVTELEDGRLRYQLHDIDVLTPPDPLSWRHRDGTPAAGERDAVYALLDLYVGQVQVVPPGPDDRLALGPAAWARTHRHHEHG